MLNYLALSKRAEGSVYLLSLLSDSSDAQAISLSAWEAPLSWSSEWISDGFSMS